MKKKKNENWLILLGLGIDFIFDKEDHKRINSYLVEEYRKRENKKGVVFVLVLYTKDS